MNQEIFEKQINKKTSLMIGIFFVVLAILTIYLTYYLFQNDEKTIRSLHDVIVEDKIDQYAYINAEIMTDEFATLDNQKAYFIWDNTYTYIVVLTEENQKKLSAVLEYSYDETKEKPESVKIKGYTKEIPDDLKKIAIESYNELFKEQILTHSNFQEYLGILYLDTYDNPMNQYGIGLLFFASIFGIIGILLILSHYKNKKKTKKCLEQYADEIEIIKGSLDNPDNIYFKKQKMILTKKYIIILQGKLEIIEYQDIIWYYPYEQRVNGVVSNRSLYVITTDFKKHFIHSFAVFGKDKENFGILYDKIAESCPNALEGYTKENQQIIKEKKANK